MIVYPWARCRWRYLQYSKDKCSSEKNLSSRSIISREKYLGTIGKITYFHMGKITYAAWRNIGDGLNGGIGVPLADRVFDQIGGLLQV